MVSVMPTPTAPTANSMPRVLLLTLQPWKCTDETMEIVIERSHLQVRVVRMPASITQVGHILLQLLRVGATGLSPASG